MARRKKVNPLGDLYRLASMVPWWAGVIVAIVSYLVLHSFAIADVAVAKGTREFAHSAVQAVIKGFAFIGQFVVPAIFLAGAAASGLAKFKRERLSRSNQSVAHRNTFHAAGRSSISQRLVRSMASTAPTR